MVESCRDRETRLVGLFLATLLLGRFPWCPSGVAWLGWGWERTQGRGTECVEFGKSGKVGQARGKGWWNCVCLCRIEREGQGKGKV